MVSIKNIAEAEAVLAQYVPLAKSITGKNITLKRMDPLMTALGNPQDRLKIIHVAGTSGKTSTCYYVAALLAGAGKKVGLTVSPHIDSVTERLQINSKPLADEVFVSALSEYLEIVEGAGLQPTYFELLIGLAYWYFEREKVDFAVVETGLGGLHDATNIADDPDKVCVITDIGIDHTHVLGHTITEIAAQKGGIVHQGNTVFMLKQSEEIMQVIKDRCGAVGAELRIVPDFTESRLPAALPAFQQRNAELAYHVCRSVLHSTDRLALLEDVDFDVPGRMDTTHANGVTIIMDGAHNEQKMRAFVDSFLQLYPGKKVPVLFALKVGKEAVSVLPILKSITSTLIVTEYETAQDLPVPALDSSQLGILAQKFGIETLVIKEAADAYTEFIKLATDIGVVTGSFYLIGQIRRAR